MKLRRQEEGEQIRTAVEKMKHCLIFSREIFYVTVVLCLNILWLKAVNELTAMQTRTGFAKFSKKLQHRIFNHGHRISVANFQVLDRSQNYRIFNVRLLFGLRNITVQQLAFWPTLYRLLMLYTACSRRCYWCDSQTPACFAGGNVTDPGTKAGQAE